MINAGERIWCEETKSFCFSAVCRSKERCFNAVLRETAGVIALLPEPEQPLPPIVPEMLDTPPAAVTTPRFLCSFCQRGKVAYFGEICFFCEEAEDLQALDDRDRG